MIIARYDEQNSVLGRRTKSSTPEWLGRQPTHATIELRILNVVP